MEALGTLINAGPTVYEDSARKYGKGGGTDCR